MIPTLTKEAHHAERDGYFRVHRSNRGFTLLELLLVLALIVAVTSLAMPALFKPFDNQRLRLAAEQIRASWVKSRARAMEKGRTFVFRFTPGTDSFTVEPWLTEGDYLESNQLVSMGVDANGKSLTIETAQVEKLPDNVLFLGSELAVDKRGDVLTLTSMNASAESQTTPHIFFYPDGTTSTARLVLANNRGRQVTLTMRGLTGVIHVSDLHTQQD